MPITETSDIEIIDVNINIHRATRKRVIVPASASGKRPCMHACRGPPARKYSVEDLRKHIIEHNLKFKQIVDGGWNEYETENTIVQVRNILRSVDKTSLFDPAGMPSYLVNFEAIVTVKPRAKPTTN